MTYFSSNMCQIQPFSRSCRLRRRSISSAQCFQVRSLVKTRLLWRGSRLKLAGLVLLHQFVFNALPLFQYALFLHDVGKRSVLRRLIHKHVSSFGWNRSFSCSRRVLTLSRGNRLRSGFRKWIIILILQKKHQKCIKPSFLKNSPFLPLPQWTFEVLRFSLPFYL